MLKKSEYFSSLSTVVILKIEFRIYSKDIMDRITHPYVLGSLKEDCLVLFFEIMRLWKNPIHLGNLETLTQPLVNE